MSRFRPRQVRETVTLLGPGIVLAATGVGAGDLVAAAVSGAEYGFAVAWAAAVGALLKFALNEGIARWQLATGTTLLEGWTRHLGVGVQRVFLVYLVVWSFVVAGALSAACGLAAHALVPALSVEVWAILHAVIGALLVAFGRYDAFEKSIGLFVGVMFLTLLACAFLSGPPVDSLARIVSEASVPPGSVKALLGVIGGVGGSVTLLAYGYWIREKGWEGEERLPLVRADLTIAYVLTGVFGLAVMVLASRVIHGRTEIGGDNAALVMARMLSEVVGPTGQIVFLVGFWGAVASSLLGVWQGIPYLFADFVGRMKRGGDGGAVDRKSPAYRGFLLWLALPPLVLLYFGKPVGLTVVYAVFSSLFMPFLAATLLYLNSRRKWVGDLRSGPVMTALLVGALGLFAYLAVVQQLIPLVTDLLGGAS